MVKNSPGEFRKALSATSLLGLNCKLRSQSYARAALVARARLVTTDMQVPEGTSPPVESPMRWPQSVLSLSAKRMHWGSNCSVSCPSGGQGGMLGQGRHGTEQKERGLRGGSGDRHGKSLPPNPRLSPAPSKRPT